MLNKEELMEILNTLSRIDDVDIMREKITSPAALVYTEAERRGVEEFLAKYDS